MYQQSLRAAICESPSVLFTAEVVHPRLAENAVLVTWSHFLQLVEPAADGSKVAPAWPFFA